MSKVPVVDFRAMVGLGMGNAEPSPDDSSDEEDEEEIWFVPQPDRSLRSSKFPVIDSHSPRPRCL